MLIATIIIGQVGNQDLFCHRQKHFLQNITIGVRHLKGIVHNFFYFWSELIFWIVMRCGIADFGRRGLKMPKTQDFCVFILSPGTSTRGAGDLDSRRQSRSIKIQKFGV